MKIKWLITATAIEIVGIITVSTGIGFEIATGADLGYVLITLGSVITAGGGLIFAKVLRARK
ncbi:MAG TPA: histidine kinase [Dehalococcoidia bacterium]|nr:histidine kinase [Dehalococcoidia bacterium]